MAVVIILNQVEWDTAIWTDAVMVGTMEIRLTIYMSSNDWAHEKIDKVPFRPQVGLMYLLTCGPQAAVPQICKCSSIKQVWPTTVNANNRTVMPQISKFKV